MSVRVELVVKNNTDIDVECTDIKCEKFEDLVVGSIIASKGEKTFSSTTNDRIFCTFSQKAPGAGKWQLAMTCPKSSHNSACGSYCAGLQKYERKGTPVTFTFILGTENLADWSHGDRDAHDTVVYGDCS